MLVQQEDSPMERRFVLIFYMTHSSVAWYHTFPYKREKNWTDFPWLRGFWYPMGEVKINNYSQWKSMEHGILSSHRHTNLFVRQIHPQECICTTRRKIILIFHISSPPFPCLVQHIVFREKWTFIERENLDFP